MVDDVLLPHLLVQGWPVLEEENGYIEDCLFGKFIISVCVQSDLAF